MLSLKAGVNYYFQPPEARRHQNQQQLTHYSSMGDLSKRLDLSEQHNPINLMETELWKQDEQQPQKKNNLRRSEKYIDFIQKMAGPLASKVLRQDRHTNSTFKTYFPDSAPNSPPPELASALVPAAESALPPQ